LGQLDELRKVDIATKAMFDFKFFVENVFNAEIPDFINEIVKEILNVLNDESKDGIAIILPRGHSKTWSITMFFAIWMMWRQDNFRMCLTSSVLDQAESFMNEIQNKIRSSHFFDDILPQNTKKAWSSTRTYFTNESKYIIKTFNDSIRGTHVNLFFCDDILREGKLSSDEISKIFWGVLYPTIQTRGGKIILVGTPLYIGDLFSEIATKPSFKVKKYQAVITDENGNWIKPLWEKKFSLEKLAKIKETMSPILFEREYMCNPIAGSAGIFGPDILKRQSDSFEISIPKKGCNYYLGIDIALSSQARADYTVFTVIEKDENNHFWVRRLERYKGVSPGFIIERTEELDKIFNFIKIAPEDRGLSQGIVIDMKNINLHPQIAPKVEGFVTTKNNKELIISNLSQHLNIGDLHILPNDVLFNELSSFCKVIDKNGKETFEGVGEHDDTVMSLGIALNAALSLFGEYFIDFV